MVLAILCLGLTAPIAQTTEEEILRQIKTDVFEERWEAVLAGCERLLEAYPQSASRARTMYYRAKALQNLPGRQEEAVAAYGEFIKKFPDETLLREDAMIGQMGLAKSLWLRGQKDHVRVLMDYLDSKGYPQIYAAIQISHLDNRPARARALPILQKCASSDDVDPEVRNECTLGILRIDPGALPVPPRPPGPEPPPGQRLAPPSGVTPSPPPPPGAEPKLIRLEVRDKDTGKVTVAVNLPIAFAEALLASLSAFEQGEVVNELKNRGIDVNNLWKSLKTLGPQTLVQIETEEANIRIWLE
jgi:hypothetical protein